MFLGLGLFPYREGGRPTPRTRRVLTHRPLNPPFGPEIPKFLRWVSEADTLRARSCRLIVTAIIAETFGCGNGRRKIIGKALLTSGGVGMLRYGVSVALC
jgi:hypothetical protein